MIQRTLSIIKPDAVERNLVGVLIAIIQEAGLKIIGIKMLHITKIAAQSFYAVHREYPFFASLTQYMSSGPIVVMALEGEAAIARYRELMGATIPANAAKGTIRRRYGLDVEKNTLHGSDTPETAAWEIAYFFSKLELVG